MEQRSVQGGTTTDHQEMALHKIVHKCVPKQLGEPVLGKSSAVCKQPNVGFSSRRAGGASPPPGGVWSTTQDLHLRLARCSACAVDGRAVSVGSSERSPLIRGKLSEMGPTRLNRRSFPLLVLSTTGRIVLRRFGGRETPFRPFLIFVDERSRPYPACLWPTRLPCGTEEYGEEYLWSWSRSLSLLGTHQRHGVIDSGSHHLRRLWKATLLGATHLAEPPQPSGMGGCKRV